MKIRRKKKEVVAKGAKKEVDFAAMLDEISIFAGPAAIWYGIDDKLEVALLAFSWYVLCKSWAERIRRNK